MSLYNYVDIDWPDLFKDRISAKPGFFTRVRINREVIPIIFVPGIMGSRLRSKQTKESVWDPDREIMCMLRKYGGWWNTPAQRKRMIIGSQFNPEYLEVNEDDQRHNDKFFNAFDAGRSKRGWGGIYWDAYGWFIETLQNYKWIRPVKSEGDERLKELAGECFEFPVHAFGYNWTDSNKSSGEKLAKYIDDTIEKYKLKGRLCKYVILVTHSMGGLVARAACKLSNAEKNKKVLGVIHGVQPVTGAAAAYWRIKAGFERTGGLANKVSAWCLGTNGEEVTCILGNAPGGLELLPNKHYKNNKGESAWLSVPLKSGTVGYPRFGDPYEEIYKLEKSEFWRLINPSWLEPRDKKSPPIKPYNDADKSWDKYIKCLKKAKKFHDELKMYRHQNTYQFYSSGLGTVDKISFGREELSMITRQNIIASQMGDVAAFETTEPSRQATARGKSVMYVDYCDQEITVPVSSSNNALYALSMSRINDYQGGGDGTVPDSSGNAFEKEVLHNLKLNKVEHQEAYKQRDALDFVVTAIRNLAIKRIKEGETASAE